jgi:hypothetical protein
MGAEFDRVIASLHRRLARETGAHLRRGMHYPVCWDPFFKDFMTIADIYHYPTQHFGFPGGSSLSPALTEGRPGSKAQGQVMSLDLRITPP